MTKFFQNGINPGFLMSTKMSNVMKLPEFVSYSFITQTSVAVPLRRVLKILMLEKCCQKEGIKNAQVSAFAHRNNSTWEYTAAYFINSYERHFTIILSWNTSRKILFFSCCAKKFYFFLWSVSFIPKVFGEERRMKIRMES